MSVALCGPGGLLDEPARLAALDAYAILDTPREQDFDDIAALASEICDTPIAVVNLVGATRQWFKAEVGLGVRETPLETSFCGHAILQDDFMHVGDALEDPRFRDNPLVCGGPGLRFYAGALLRTARGHAIGTLCVLDYKPRALSERQRLSLVRLARQVMSQLELRMSRDEYRHAMALNPQVGWTATADGQLDQVGARWREWTGTSGLGMGWALGLHPSDVAPTTAAWLHSVRTGEPYDVEHRVRQRAGGFCWARSRAFPRRDAAGRGGEGLGRIVRWYGTTEDIDERKRAEQALQSLNATLEQQVADRTAALAASEARMRMVFETSYQLRWLLAPDGALLEANATALELVEVAAAAVAGAPFWAAPWFAATPGMPEAMREAVAGAAAGQAMRREMQLMLPGGARWLDLTVRPIGDGSGGVASIIGEAVDTTERREAEERLRQAQKLEAIGLLTGGVAHDFNNLLMIVSSGLDLLERRDDPARRMRVLGGMRQAVDRGATLTRQLLAFSRRQALQPEPIDLVARIGAMREMLDRSLRGDVEVRTELPAALWPVDVDPGELELVVLNLAVNARDAMPGGGTIAVGAENVVGLRDGALEGDFVRLWMRDTGTGMAPEVLARVFEPFFTTKEVGKGSGLGLAQTLGFAQASGGDARVESRLGGGTTVSLLLPRTTKPVAVDRAVSRVSAPVVAGPAGAAVLLVEDDDEVAAFVAEMLEQLGYRVLRVGGAQAALGALASGQAVDLVFSDVMMPGPLDGVGLAREVGRRWPGLPVVLATGFAEGVTGAVEGPGLRRLSKPYRLQDLAVALAGALDEAGARA